MAITFSSKDPTPVPSFSNNQFGQNRFTKNQFGQGGGTGRTPIIRPADLDEERQGIWMDAYNKYKEENEPGDDEKQYEIDAQLFAQDSLFTWENENRYPLLGGLGEAGRQFDQSPFMPSIRPMDLPEDLQQVWLNAYSQYKANNQGADDKQLEIAAQQAAQDAVREDQYGDPAEQAYMDTLQKSLELADMTLEDYEQLPDEYKKGLRDAYENGVSAVDSLEAYVQNNKALLRLRSGAWERKHNEQYDEQGDKYDRLVREFESDSSLPNPWDLSKDFVAENAEKRKHADELYEQMKKEPGFLDTLRELGIDETSDINYSWWDITDDERQRIIDAYRKGPEAVQALKEEYLMHGMEHYPSIVEYQTEAMEKILNERNAHRQQWNEHYDLAEQYYNATGITESELEGALNYQRKLQAKKTEDTAIDALFDETNPDNQAFLAAMDEAYLTKEDYAAMTPEERQELMAAYENGGVSGLYQWAMGYIGREASKGRDMSGTAPEEPEDVTPAEVTDIMRSTVLQETGRQLSKQLQEMDHMGDERAEQDKDLNRQMRELKKKMQPLQDELNELDKTLDHNTLKAKYEKQDTPEAERWWQLHDELDELQRQYDELFAQTTGGQMGDALQELTNWAYDVASMEGAAMQGGMANWVDRVVSFADGLTRMVHAGDVARWVTKLFYGGDEKKNALIDKLYDHVLDIGYNHVVPGWHEELQQAEQNSIAVAKSYAGNLQPYMERVLESAGLPDETRKSVAQFILNDMLISGAENYGQMLPSIYLSALGGISGFGYDKAVGFAGKAKLMAQKLGDVLRNPGFWDIFVTETGEAMQQAITKTDGNPTDIDLWTSTFAGFNSAIIELYETALFGGGIQGNLRRGGFVGGSIKGMVQTMLQETYEENAQDFNLDFWQDVADALQGRQLSHPLTDKEREGLFSYADHWDITWKTAASTFGMGLIQGTTSIGQNYTRRAVEATLNGTATMQQRQVYAQVAAAAGMIDKAEREGVDMTDLRNLTNLNPDESQQHDAFTEGLGETAGQKNDGQLPAAAAETVAAPETNALTDNLTADSTEQEKRATFAAALEQAGVDPLTVQMVREAQTAGDVQQVLAMYRQNEDQRNQQQNEAKYQDYKDDPEQLNKYLQAQQAEKERLQKEREAQDAQLRQLREEEEQNAQRKRMMEAEQAQQQHVAEQVTQDQDQQRLTRENEEKRAREEQAAKYRQDAEARRLKYREELNKKYQDLIGQYQRGEIGVNELRRRYDEITKELQVKELQESQQQWEEDQDRRRREQAQRKEEEIQAQKAKEDEQAALDMEHRADQAQYDQDEQAKREALEQGQAEDAAAVRERERAEQKEADIQAQKEMEDEQAAAERQAELERIEREREETKRRLEAARKKNGSGKEQQRLQRKLRDLNEQRERLQREQQPAPEYTAEEVQSIVDRQGVAETPAAEEPAALDMEHRADQEQYAQDEQAKREALEQGQAQDAEEIARLEAEYDENVKRDRENETQLRDALGDRYQEVKDLIFDFEHEIDARKRAKINKQINNLLKEAGRENGRSTDEIYSLVDKYAETRNEVNEFYNRYDQRMAELRADAEQYHQTYQEQKADQERYAQDQADKAAAIEQGQEEQAARDEQQADQERYTQDEQAKQADLAAAQMRDRKEIERLENEREETQRRLEEAGRNRRDRDLANALQRKLDAINDRLERLQREQQPAPEYTAEEVQSIVDRQGVAETPETQQTEPWSTSGLEENPAVQTPETQNEEDAAETAGNQIAAELPETREEEPAAEEDETEAPEQEEQGTPQTPETQPEEDEEAGETEGNQTVTEPEREEPEKGEDETEGQKPETQGQLQTPEQTPEDEGDTDSSTGTPVTRPQNNNNPGTEGDAEGAKPETQGVTDEPQAPEKLPEDEDGTDGNTGTGTQNNNNPGNEGEGQGAPQTAETDENPATDTPEAENPAAETPEAAETDENPATEPQGEETEEQKSQNARKVARNFGLNYLEKNGTPRAGVNIRSWSSSVSQHQASQVSYRNSGRTAMVDMADLKAIDEYAKKRGIAVVIDDTIDNSTKNGYYQQTPGNPFTVHIAQDAENPLRTVFGHELYHAIVANNPAAARSMQQAWLSYAQRAGLDMAAETQKIADLYKKNGLTVPSAAVLQEEVIANSLYDIIGDQRTMQVLAAQNRGMVQQIRNWVSKVLQDIRSITSRYADRDAGARMLRDTAGAMENMRRMIDKAMERSEAVDHSKKAVKSLGENGPMTKRYQERMEKAENRQDANRATRQLAQDLLRRMGLEASAENVNKMLNAALDFNAGRVAMSSALQRAGFPAVTMDAEMNRAFGMLAKYMDSIMGRDTKGYMELMKGEPETTPEQQPQKPREPAVRKLKRGDDVKLSLKDMQKLTWDQQMDRYYRTNEQRPNRDDIFEIAKASDMAKLDIDAPVVIEQSDLTKATREQKLDKSKSAHGLSEKNVRDLSRAIKDPVARIETNRGIVLVTDQRDLGKKKNDDGGYELVESPVIVPMAKAKVEGQRVYKVPTIFARPYMPTLYGRWDNGKFKALDPIRIDIYKENSINILLGRADSLGRHTEVYEVLQSIIEQSKNVKFSLKNVSAEQDAAYMEAVERGDMDAAKEMVDRAAEENGYNVHAYHGTSRGDRVGNVFRPERATSGPMAFFTDNREIAENYARDKKDTSIAYDERYDSYESQFRAEKSGKDESLVELWKKLPASAKAAIMQKAGHVTFDYDADDGSVIFDKNNTNGLGNFQWAAREAKGNYLQALVEEWLNSGNLYNEESKFLKVLELAGVNDALKKAGYSAPVYFNPDEINEKVFDVYMNIENPFVTSTSYDQKFVEGLKEWWEKQDKAKYAQESRGADFWDKNRWRFDEWIEKAEEDIERGETLAWTSIPDFVTDYLKEQGYDGIQDEGGKKGGNKHTVWIPFSSEQVKDSAPVTYDDQGKVIPLSERFNPSEEDIRWSVKDDASVTQLTRDLEKTRDADVTLQTARALTARLLEANDTDVNAMTRGQLLSAAMAYTASEDVGQALEGSDLNIQLTKQQDVSALRAIGDAAIRLMEQDPEMYEALFTEETPEEAKERKKAARAQAKARTADEVADAWQVRADYAGTDQNAHELIVDLVDAITNIRTKATMDQDGRVVRQSGHWKAAVPTLAKAIQQSLGITMSEETVKRTVREALTNVDEELARGVHPETALDNCLNMTLASLTDLYMAELNKNSDRAQITKDALNLIRDKVGSLVLMPTERSEVEAAAEDGLKGFRKVMSGVVDVRVARVNKETGNAVHTTGQSIEDVYKDEDVVHALGLDPDLANPGDQVMDLYEKVRALKTPVGRAAITTEETDMLHKVALNLVASYFTSGENTTVATSTAVVSDERHQEVLRQAEQLEKEVSEKQDELMMAQSELSALEEKYNAVVQNSQNLYNTLMQERKANVPAAQLEDLRNQMLEAQQNEAQAQKDLKAAERKLKDLQKRQTERQQKLRNLQKQLRAQEKQNEKQQRQMDRMLGRIDKLNNQILMEKNKVQQARTKAKAQQNRQASLDNIRKQGTVIRKMLAQPGQKTGYVPQEYVRTVADFVQALSENDGRKSAEMGKRVRDMVRDAQTSSDYSAQQLFADGLSDMVDRSIRLLEDKGALRNLTDEELRLVENTVAGVVNQLQYMNKFISNELKRERQESAAEAIGVLNKNPRAHRGAAGVASNILLQHMNAERVLDQLAHHQDNAISQSNEMFKNGYRVSGLTKMNMTKPYESLTTGENAKKFDRFAGKNATLYDTGIQILDTMGNETGRTWKLTAAQRVSLWFDVNYDQNREGMRAGMKREGQDLYQLTVPDQELLKKGKTDQAYKEGDRVYFTLDEVKAILDEMTDYDMAWVDAFKQMELYSRGVINDTSLRLKGYRLATVQDYFPIRRDSNFTKSDFQSVVVDNRLENQGWTKSRVNAHNPMLLMDVTQVINSQIQGVSDYVGYAIPIRDFTMLMNTSVGNNADSVKAAIARTQGTEMIKYLDQLMGDLQGTNRTENTWIDNLRGKQAAATLTLNMSVQLKQTASYPVAAAVVGWSPLAKAMGSFLNRKSIDPNGYRELYTSAYWERQNLKLSDMEANANRNNALKKGLNWIGNGIQRFDLATTDVLWQAAKIYVEQNTGLQPGTEEEIRSKQDAYYKKVADVYNEILEKSQPEYNVWQRPGILRSKSQLMKAMTMFKTQSLQNLGMTVEAFSQLKDARETLKENDTADNREAVSQAKRQLANTISSQVVSAIVLAVFSMLGKALFHRMRDYKDDKGDITAASAGRQIAKDSVSSMAGMVVGGSELFDLIMGWIEGKAPYDIEAAGVSTINDLYQNTFALRAGVSGLFDADLTPEEKMQKFAPKAKKFASSLVQLFGIPMDNAIKLVDGIATNAKEFALGKPLAFEEGGFLGAAQGRETSNAAVAGYIAQAMMDGNTAEAERLYNGQLAQGKTPEAINTAIATWQKANIPEIREAAEAIENGDVNLYNRLIKEITQKGISTANAVKYVESERQKIKKAEKAAKAPETEQPAAGPQRMTYEQITAGMTKEASEQLYTNGMMNSLLEDGNVQQAMAVRDAMLEAGKKQSAISSSLSNYWKPLLLEAYEAGDMMEVKRITDMLVSMGMSRSTIQGWTGTKSSSSKKSSFGKSSFGSSGFGKSAFGSGTFGSGSFGKTAGKKSSKKKWSSKSF